jgi:protein-tyrosine phosphatase
VERQDDQYVIHWQEDADTITIYESTAPTTTVAGAPLAQVSHQNEVSIMGLDPTIRHYFQIVFSGGGNDGWVVVVAERFVRLEGAGNFRDLGGYQTSDGRTVRWGQVYRSGNLSSLTDADLQQLTDLDLHLIIDLRYEEDIEAAPDRLPNTPGLQSLVLPIFTADDSPMTRMDFFFRRDRLPEIQALGNQRMVDEKTAVIGEIFNQLADDNHLPIVIHCSNGCMRTGFISALLLSALGVPDETIIADYTLSNLDYDGAFQSAQDKVRMLSIFGVTADDLQPMFLAQPSTMEDILDYIHVKYGSVEAYLTGAVGLSPEAIQRLRDNLLYP